MQPSAKMKYHLRLMTKKMNKFIGALKPIVESSFSG